MGEINRDEEIDMEYTERLSCDRQRKRRRDNGAGGRKRHLFDGQTQENNIETELKSLKGLEKENEREREKVQVGRME